MMYLSARARQPARGPTMLAHLVAMLAYVGLCWPMLAYLEAKMGQHSPKMGQHSPKMGQHSPKMGPHCPQDRPT